MKVYLAVEYFNYRKDGSFKIHGVYNTPEDAKNHVMDLVVDMARFTVDDQYFILSNSDINGYVNVENPVIGDLYSTSDGGYEASVFYVCTSEYSTTYMKKYTDVSKITARRPGEPDPNDVYFTIDDRKYSIKTCEEYGYNYDFLLSIVGDDTQYIIKALEVTGTPNALKLVKVIRELPDTWKKYMVKVGSRQFNVGCKKWGLAIINDLEMSEPKLFNKTWN